MILHITTENRWHEETAEGRAYRGDTLATDGFIHLSTQAQVLATADRFFSGRAGLILVCVDEERLTSELRYEDPGEGQRFPHLYGPLNPEAVLTVLPFAPSADGSFELPALPGRD